jgi:hypothetical protein
MPSKTAAFLTILIHPSGVLDCSQQFFMLLKLLLVALLYNILRNQIVLGIPPAMFAKPSVIQLKQPKKK